MKKILSLLCLGTLLLASCVTLPEKSSPDDAMVLIPIAFDKSNPGNVFGKIRITIADENGNKVTTLKLPTDADYRFANLAPGKYIISEMTFVYDDGRLHGMDSPMYPFEVFPGTITIPTIYMSYEFYTNVHKDHHNFMWGSFKLMTPEVRANLTDVLMAEEAAASWEIQYYTPPQRKKTKN